MGSSPRARGTGVGGLWTLPIGVAGGVVFLGAGDNSLASPSGVESGDTRMEEEEGESLLVGFPKALVALVCPLYLGPAPKLLLAGLGWQH